MFIYVEKSTLYSCLLRIFITKEFVLCQMLLLHWLRWLGFIALVYLCGWFSHVYTSLCLDKSHLVIVWVCFLSLKENAWGWVICEEKIYLAHGSADCMRSMVLAAAQLVVRTFVLSVNIVKKVKEEVPSWKGDQIPGVSWLYNNPFPQEPILSRQWELTHHREDVTKTFMRDLPRIQTPLAKPHLPIPPHEALKF